ncbi:MULTISPECIES: response regulator [Pseudomonas]|uniref:Response regulator receiver domain-containing protein n=1 Tax=Pseudomonas oryzihabitans TaxID=47885 RepID=A0A178L6F3_9PSED|nr:MULTISPECIES: response regulator [Pseudomonas]NMY91790.1 response regulator [Pseudomonas psychrotolerans]NMY91997.1 response regulator [Pseudomonas psychrotolerans]NRH44430.1 response regulator [Pseudomonas sp. MS15a(2019)]OAN25021.1 response regulator receiver protein [Pseudomonas oryzihabitans]SCZ47651.1 Response regulator receiver domain-containing protein [Pseudomonas psychrotolerans]
MINLNSFRVAVVEDDALLCQILEDVLRERGAECKAFPNADDALVDILNSGKPDLLITDHLVPGQLTGADLAQLLTSRWPSLPIIITTGYGYDIQKDLPPNVVYLQKPWLSETLENAIADVLR